MCSHVTEETLKNCPTRGEFDNDDDGNDDDGNDTSEEPHQAAPMRRSLRKAEDDARWKQHRDAEMTKLQDHYYRVRSKLLSCKREEFLDRAAIVDAHLLAAFRELGDVEDIADTTVAHRYRDDPNRRAPTPTKRTRTKASGESAPVAAAQAAAQGRRRRRRKGLCDTCLSPCDHSYFRLRRTRGAYSRRRTKRYRLIMVHPSKNDSTCVSAQNCNK